MKKVNSSKNPTATEAVVVKDNQLLYDGKVIIAVGQRYICRPLKRAAMSHGGLHLPEGAKDRVQLQSKIMAYGTERGCGLIGDRVLHNPHAGTPLLMDSDDGKTEQWRILAETDLLAIIRGDKEEEGL